MYQDTIAAIATPPGEGGIGIVRLSGPESRAIVGRLFSTEPKDRQVVHGHIRDPQRNEVIDEVLVISMAAPRTYTREDVVEIHCHGSPLVLQQVLGLALQEGARLAQPGEFTLRAFLNGRLDLAQAEAVLDVIRARTEASLRLSLQGLQGRLSEPLRRVRAKILRLHAYLTACIDFPEDEVEQQMQIDPPAITGEAAEELQELLDSAAAGMVYRLGARTAIIGRPNVGKSSLLNRLLGEERAIVTPTPGTTRDTVEETVSIQGIPFLLVDTAGIQKTQDLVEHLGIQRSRKAVEEADLLLMLVDASTPLTEEDRQILSLANGRATLVVANKCDLPIQAALGELPPPVVRISALTGEGLEQLRQEIAREALGGRVIASDAVLVTNPRHKAALERALVHLRGAQKSLQARMPHDFVTIDLGACLGALGEITGESVTEELLDAIFREFCIGK